MQQLLGRLDPVIVIILLVAVVLVAVVVVVVMRRMRQRPPSIDEALGAASGLTGQVDYTSLPLDDEPTGWRERFTNLSLASKILVILVPILVVLGVIVLVLALSKGGAPSVQKTPVPVTLTVTKAEIVGDKPEIKLSVAAGTTGLSDGTEVTVEFLANGTPIPYLRSDEAKGVVRRDLVEIRPRKSPTGPSAQQNVEYAIRVSTADGQVSGELPLTVLPQFKAGFFGIAATEVTPTLTATSEPTAVPPTATPAAPGVTPEPTAVPPTAEPTVAPTALPSGGSEVVIGHGGNVRAMPFVTSKNRVGGVDAGNKVQLLEQTPNGQWYRIRFINTDDKKEREGWVSASLISLPATVKAKISVATIVSVFKNGGVYEQPDAKSTEKDRVNVGEVVELKRKNAAGSWYEVTSVRGLSGWVQASLLGIPPAVAAKVSVAP
ncbi:MAG: SH3 domain-containing protein [Chloroflexales bacterium]|jgi:Bacterial SH3 domain